MPDFELRKMSGGVHAPANAVEPRHIIDIEINATTEVEPMPDAEKPVVATTKQRGPK